MKLLCTKPTHIPFRQIRQSLTFCLICFSLCARCPHTNTHFICTHAHARTTGVWHTYTHVHIHTSAYIPMHTCTHVLFSLNQPSLGCMWRGACMIHPSPLPCGFLGKLSSHRCAVQLATSGGRALIGHFVRVIYSISASAQDPGWAHV